MAFWRRIQRLAAFLLKSAVVLGGVVLIALSAGIATIESSWGKNRLRQLLVRQANEYLTATVEIGRLEGSLFRGILLGDIRLSRGGRPLIEIDDISLRYSIRELLQQGVVIRQIRLARPRVVM